MRGHRGGMFGFVVSPLRLLWKWGIFGTELWGCAKYVLQPEAEHPGFKPVLPFYFHVTQCLYLYETHPHSKNFKPGKTILHVWGRRRIEATEVVVVFGSAGRFQKTRNDDSMSSDGDTGWYQTDWWVLRTTVLVCNLVKEHSLCSHLTARQI